MHWIFLWQRKCQKLAVSSIWASNMFVGQAMNADAYFVSFDPVLASHGTVFDMAFSA